MIAQSSFEEIRVPVSSGAEIAVDRYPAQGAGPAPSIILFTPYLKGDVTGVGFPLDALVADGFTVLVADVAGTGASTGTFAGPLSPGEVTDCIEVLDWVAAQPWSTGRIGLGGGSYGGALQLLIAARRPRALSCIAPAVAPLDYFRDWTHRGGIPSNVAWAANAMLNIPQPHAVESALMTYATASATPVDGELFWERSAGRTLDDIEVPALFMGGLFDFFSRGSLRGFDELGSPKRLVLGPWGHRYPEDPSELLAWYRYWLRGEGDDPTARGNVRMWRIGGDDWVTTTGRVLPDAPTRLGVDGPVDVPVHPTPRGFRPPAAPAPLDPVEGVAAGIHAWGEDALIPLLTPTVDFAGVPVFRADVRLGGCTDADLNVRLNLRRADGTLVQLTEGRLRLSHREVDEASSRRYADGSYESIQLRHTDPEPLPDGTATTVAFELLPTSVRIAPGAELVLGVAAIRNDGRSRRADLRLENIAVLLPEAPQ